MTAKAETQFRRLYGLLATAGLLLADGALLSAEPAVERSPSEIPRLVLQLDSSSFQERISAQRALTAVATESPALILEQLPSAGPEASSRLVRLLETIFLSNDNPRGDQAEKALEAISRLDSPVAADADAILRGHARLRQARACRDLTRLNAEIVYVAPPEPHSAQVLVSRRSTVAPGIGVGFGEPILLDSIWLHEDFVVGEESLWHLNRLASCPDLSLNKFHGLEFSDEALQQLAIAIPGLEIQDRGPCLGVRSHPSYDRCIVGDVMKGGAAEKSGIRANDHIYRLGEDLNGDGKFEVNEQTDVNSFQRLVELLQKHDIGDKVIFHIERGSERLEIPVTLVSWKGIPSQISDTAPAPRPFQGPLEKRQASREAPQPPASPASPQIN